MNTILTNLIAAVPTTIVACIAAYIAYQQWRTNRRRLQLDLYDRRLRLYEAVIKYIIVVKTDFRPKLDDLIEFRRSTAEADFLFGPDIRAYLNELFKHGVQLRGWAEKNNRDYIQSMPPDYDHRKVTDGMQREEDWFIDQGEKALKQFKSYLNLAERSRK